MAVLSPSTCYTTPPEQDTQSTYKWIVTGRYCIAPSHEPRAIELHYRNTTNDISVEGLESGRSLSVRFMLTLTDNPHSLPAFRYYSPKPRLIEDQTELCLRCEEQMRLYRMAAVKRLFRDSSPFPSAVIQIGWALTRSTYDICRH